MPRKYLIFGWIIGEIRNRKNANYVNTSALSQWTVVPWEICSANSSHFLAWLYVFTSEERLCCIVCNIIDLLRNRLTFDLDNKKEITYHNCKERIKISPIAKFSCKMLGRMENRAEQSGQILYTFVLRRKCATELVTHY